MRPHDLVDNVLVRGEVIYKLSHIQNFQDLRGR